MEHSKVLIDLWIETADQDQQIDEIRKYKNTTKPSVQNQMSNPMKQITQKLNRLERNFLRQDQTKKQVKPNETNNQRQFQLEQLYLKASLILTQLKLKEEDETVQIKQQIIGLYNKSVAELTKKQRLDKANKQLQRENNKIDQRLIDLDVEKKSAQKQLSVLRAQNWLTEQRSK